MITVEPTDNPTQLLIRYNDGVEIGFFLWDGLRWQFWPIHRSGYWTQALLQVLAEEIARLNERDVGL